MKVTCPNCGKRLSAPGEMAGKRGKCPACGHVSVVPLPHVSDRTSAEARCVPSPDLSPSGLLGLVLDDARRLAKGGTDPAPLRAGRSRCPQCGHEVDTAANTIAPPDWETMSEGARAFMPAIMEELGIAGYGMPHVRCPDCGATWLQQRNPVTTLQQAKAESSVIVNSIGMKMAPIAAGSFRMGSPDSEPFAFDDQKPQHLVVISTTAQLFRNDYDTFISGRFSF